jgi:hypothetical protein
MLYSSIVCFAFFFCFCVSVLLSSDHVFDKQEYIIAVGMVLLSQQDEDLRLITNGGGPLPYERVGCHVSFKHNLAIGAFTDLLLKA